MYQCGDRVVYGIHGVCRIVSIEERSVDRKKLQYYVLQPLEGSSTQYFIPVHNESAVSKLRPLLSKAELEELLLSEKTSVQCWVQDENQRKLRYRELISSGDCSALISMVRSLHKHKKIQLSLGRKFHLCDENFLRDAQKLLGMEFSLVLDISPEQVEKYILDLFEENTD